MIVGTWNIRGYTPTKLTAVKGLFRTADVVCLTETIVNVAATPHWSSTNAPPLRTPAAPRRRGGVAVLSRPAIPFRLTCTYIQEYFQVVAGSLNGLPLVACYVRPKTPPQEFANFLAIITKHLRGPGLLVGDLNARNLAWDDKINGPGIALQRWAQRHNFYTCRPPKPTLCTTSGTSRVDVILYRGPVTPSLTVWDSTMHSDHRPLLAHISQQDRTELRPPPLSALSNVHCRDRARDWYQRNLPPIIRALQQCSSPASLTINSRRLAETTLAPWKDLSPPRPARFRPGWSLSLDRKAKRRKRLLRSTNPDDRDTAKRLDREMKREFRRNVRRLQDRLSDEMASSAPGEQLTIFKRALKLDGMRDIAPTKVDPDTYTDFMQSLQPDPTQTPPVPTLPFTVPDSFRDSLLRAIQKLKPKKSPGPDHIRPEIFRLEPHLFADATMALWRAIGRLTHVPSLLTSSLLSPIYKRKGDPALPTNHRPVSLTTAYRRMIATALNIELEKSYKPGYGQWGFRRGSNTECAVAYVVNQRRQNLPLTALLDLRKAYDLVPRDILQQMLDSRLPSGLSTTLRPLLAPMTLRTKLQRTQSTVRTLAGTPQGCPLSPNLFNLFMDSYLESMNTAPSQLRSSAFVDDVLLIAKTIPALQDGLNRSAQWAVDMRMQWAVSKSCGIQLPEHVTLAGEELPDKREEVYLGISLNRNAVTDSKLLSRIAAGQAMLGKLRGLIKGRPTTTQLRRMLVKTFVFSITDYLLYMQPLTERVTRRAAHLDRQCTGFTLGMNIDERLQERASYLARLLPIRARRQRQLTNSVAKFYTETQHPNAAEREQLNWHIMSNYSMIRPYVSSSHIPEKVADTPRWVKTELSRIEETLWSSVNCHVRKIPTGRKLPPVYRSDIGTHLERRASQWYLNRIPWCPELRARKPHLAKLLQQQLLNEEEVSELSIHLSSLLSNRGRHGG